MLGGVIYSAEEVESYVTRAKLAGKVNAVADCKRRIETLIKFTERDAIGPVEQATVEGMRMALRCLETA